MSRKLGVFMQKAVSFRLAFGLFCIAFVTCKGCYWVHFRQHKIEDILGLVRFEILAGENLIKVISMAIKVPKWCYSQGTKTSEGSFHFPMCSSDEKAYSYETNFFKYRGLYHNIKILVAYYFHLWSHHFKLQQGKPNNALLVSLTCTLWSRSYSRYESVLLYPSSDNVWLCS